MSHIKVGNSCIWNLPDMQKSESGFKKLAIKKVGMRNVELPVTIFQREQNRDIEVKATFSSYCNLVPEIKGINMSRISRTLIDTVRKSDRAHLDLAGFDLMTEFAKELSTAHDTDDIYVKMEFDYPYWEKTYATDLDSPEYVTVIFETIQYGDIVKNFMTVKSVGASLCPCSKEMSLLKNNMSEAELKALDTLPLAVKEKVLKAGFGAHNQRSLMDITVELKEGEKLWIEDLVEMADKSYSSPVKTVLKRPDEKIETEMPYLGGYYAEDENTGEFEFVPVEGTGPKFVEDIARDMAHNLESILDEKIIDYTVTVSNQESIHSRDIMATAVLTAGRSLN